MKLTYLIFMNEFSQKHCVPCEGGIDACSLEQARKMVMQAPGWDVIEDGKKIKREFKFGDFKEAMVFVNHVADIAESEGHHPDLHVFYNRVVIELWTHAIGGLSENDFIVAAKVNELL